MVTREKFHEALIQDKQVEFPTERSFGFVIASVFTLIGASVVWSDSMLSIAWFGVAAVILTLALVRPALLARANYLWARCGLLLGRIANPVIMFLLFVAVFTPVAIVRRLAGADPLGSGQSPRTTATGSAVRPPVQRLRVWHANSRRGN